MTHADMVRWIDDAVFFANLSDLRPNHAAIIAAVEAGTVKPDDNDGSITDDTEALLFGALVSGDAAFWFPEEPASTSPCGRIYCDCCYS